MARQTVKVSELREWANVALAAPDRFTVDGIDPHSQRIGIAGMLESALMRTGQYRGFRYLSSELTEDGTALRPGADESRRFYL